MSLLSDWTGISGPIRGDIIADSLTFSQITVTANYTIASDVHTVIADGADNTIDVTLPTAVDVRGNRKTIKAINVDNTVKIKSIGGQTIDGLTEFTFTLNQARTVESDGANWQQVT